MATWFDNQLSNRNFLSPIGFLFVLDKARKTSFLCQKVNVPTLSLGEYNVQTGLVPIPDEGNLSFGNLTIDFLVDEDLKNYMEIHNWMRALGAPDDIEKNRLVLYDEETEEYTDQRYSDATLQVLNNNNIANFNFVFKNLFPVELSALPFDVSSQDNNFFIATATFNYMTYEIRDLGSTARRKS